MEWIDVREDLPEHNQIVLGCDAVSGLVTLARFIDDNEDEYHFRIMYLEEIEIDAEITHWIPLPTAAQMVID